MIPTWLQKHIQQGIFFSSAAYTFYMVVFEPKLIYIFWLLIAMILVAGIVSAYYHRYVTHSSWKCPVWAEKVFLFLGSFFAFTQVLSWTATHNMHHRYVDTEKDPHGPHKGLMANILIAYYGFNLAYARKVNLENPLYQLQMKYYFAVAIFGFVVTSLIFSPVVWTIINTYGFLGQASVNYLGHKNGSPVNRPYLSWLLAGETYHKHHHGHPKDPYFGTWDLGGAIIKLFKKFS